MENLIILFKVFAILYVFLLCILLTHEFIHFIFIKRYKKQIKSIKINPLGGKIVYVNDHNYSHILIISAAPNIILPILGLLILYLGTGAYSNAIAIMCLLNLLNLLPFTSDGTAILYSFLKLVRKN